MIRLITTLNDCERFEKLSKLNDEERNKIIISDDFAKKFIERENDNLFIFEDYDKFVLLFNMFLSHELEDNNFSIVYKINYCKFAIKYASDSNSDYVIKEINCYELVNDKIKTLLFLKKEYINSLEIKEANK